MKVSVTSVPVGAVMVELSLLLPLQAAGCHECERESSVVDESYQVSRL